MVRTNKKVMVFGVFDRLHPGHRAFLKQAERYGKKLIVVVARDSVAWRLKKKKPKQSERVRLRVIRKVRGVSRAVLGDQRQSTYGVIKKYKPNLICLGYDQKWLGIDLKKRIKRKLVPRIRVIKLKPYHPEKFKSSKMRLKDTI